MKWRSRYDSESYLDMIVRQAFRVEHQNKFLFITMDHAKKHYGVYTLPRCLPGDDSQPPVAQPRLKNMHDKELLHIPHFPQLGRILKTLELFNFEVGLISSYPPVTSLGEEEYQYQYIYPTSGAGIRQEIGEIRHLSNPQKWPRKAMGIGWS